MTAAEERAAAEVERLRGVLTQMQRWIIEGMRGPEGTDDDSPACRANPNGAEVIRLREVLHAAEAWALEGLHPVERSGTSTPPC